MNKMKVVLPLKGSVHQTQNPKIECDNLLTRLTDEGFDRNAYKFLAKDDYNPQDPNALEKLPPKVTEEKTHRLNSTLHLLELFMEAQFIYLWTCSCSCSCSCIYFQLRTMYGCMYSYL